MKKIFSLILWLLILPLAAAELTILQTTDLHGTPHTAALLELIERERKNDPELLLIDCGDLTQGTHTAAQTLGVEMIAFLNKAEYDVFVPGNHDFDYGADILFRNVEKLNRRTAVLAGNLIPHRFPAWKLFERNGLRIAVIGIAPPYLDQWLGPGQLQGMQAEVPEAALRRIMPEIRKAKPDFVVLAIHQGRYTSGRLTGDGRACAVHWILRDFQEISIVLGGHSHESVSGRKLYPDFWFVQAPPHGAGLIKITVSADGNIKSEILFAESAGAKEDMRKTDGISCMALARLFAAAVLKSVPADAVLINTFSGVVLPPEKCSEEELFRAVPFENTITILTLSPEELHAVLEEQKTLKNYKLHLFPGGSAKGKETIRLAVTSYAAAGAGGRYPVLRKTARNCTERVDLRLSVRDAVRKYLEERERSAVPAQCGER